MQSCALGRQSCARSKFGRANRRIFEPGSYLRRRGFFVGGRCPLRGLISFLMLLFCVGAALLAPAKPPARPPEARPLPGRRRQRGGRGGLPPAHSLSSSVLLENGWWLSSCLVVRPSASAQGAATQALQRRHSGALCRAKSIHGELAGVGRYVYVASCCSTAGWYGAWFECECSGRRHSGASAPPLRRPEPS